MLRSMMVPEAKHMHPGFAVWFGDQDSYNGERLVPPHEKQLITRAELRAFLLALDKKKLGVKLHVVTDSELIFLGLKSM